MQKPKNAHFIKFNFVWRSIARILPVMNYNELISNYHDISPNFMHSSRSGLAGNMMVIIVVARVRSMHTTTNFYLASLAVADFMVMACLVLFLLNQAQLNYCCLINCNLFNLI